jgi:2-amino-4-hydroxy-6-hydroxymethyldihydropteridine diphosphokinase
VSAAGRALGAGEGHAIERVDVALGSNVEDRATHLAAARAAIGHLPRTRIVATSTVEETAPVGPAGQGPYLNQMLRLATALAPRELLDRLLAVEAAAGRVRDPARRWGPRTLDCDIVRFGARTVDEPGLTVPHPELPNRDWWLRELAELDALLGAGAPDASDASVPGGAAR